MDSQPAERPTLSDLRQRAAEYLGEHACRDRWMDGPDPVCRVHGFWWPDGQQFCNGVDQADAYQILADLAARPEDTDDPLTVEPGPLLAGVGTLLEFLADGRADYAQLYPEGSEDRGYLDTQVATCRTLARILTDQTSNTAGLFLPIGRLAGYERLLRELGLAGPDRQTLSDVALVYRQAGPTSAG